MTPPTLQSFVPDATNRGPLVMYLTSATIYAERSNGMPAMGHGPKTHQQNKSAMVHEVLSSVHEGRFRAVLALTYHCGLRLSETLRLKPGDIDVKRALRRRRRGRGQRRRPAFLNGTGPATWPAGAERARSPPRTGARSRPCRVAARPVWAGTCTAVRIAGANTTPTTAAITAAVRAAERASRSSGPSGNRPGCCPCPITCSPSPFRSDCTKSIPRADRHEVSQSFTPHERERLIRNKRSGNAAPGIARRRLRALPARTGKIATFDDPPKTKESDFRSANFRWKVPSARRHLPCPSRLQGPDRFRPVVVNPAPGAPGKLSAITGAPLRSGTGLVHLSRRS